MPSAATGIAPQDSHLQSVLVVAKDPDGGFWFAGGQPEVIGYLTANGQATDFLVPPAESTGQVPVIALGSDENLWFVEGSAQNQIGRMDSQGQLSTFAIPSGLPIQQIGSGPDGYVWFIDASGAGWIDPATSVVMEYTNFGMDFSQFSLTPDGALLLRQGQSTRQLDRAAFLAIFAPQSDGFPGGGGGSAEMPAVVLTESFANGILALPTGFAIGPIAVTNVPKLSSATPPALLELEDNPGGPPPVPTNPAEQVIWMSSADHGVRGAYSSTQRPTDSSNRSSLPREAFAGNVPLLSPVTLAKSSATESGTIRLADADSSTIAMLLARQEKLEAVAAALMDGVASGGYSAIQMVADLNMGMWRPPGWLPSDSHLPVPDRLVIASKSLPDGMDDPTDETRVDLVASIAQVTLAASDLETVPDPSTLRAIAQEYRREVRPVIPERREPASKSRFLVRLVAAWFMAQSACFGVGQKRARSQI